MKAFLTTCAAVCIAMFTTDAPTARAADAVRGHMLFRSNCNMCHPGGENVLNPQKPLKGDWFQREFPRDSMIVDVIRKGIPKTVMTPFTKERLSDEQVADIIAYVRTLTPPAKPPEGKKTNPVPSGSKQGPKQGSAIRH